MKIPREHMARVAPLVEDRVKATAATTGQILSNLVFSLIVSLWCHWQHGQVGVKEETQGW